jgi:hypothetical protein
MLASACFERLNNRTRRATFLAEMESVVPWRELCAQIEPVNPKVQFHPCSRRDAYVSGAD